jgi:2,4-dienoyl-CoA reductase-like NADH-dependent reductase (Old Yellow Enzyme family)
MTTVHRANDPLLQPFQLKHLTLRNRLMSTAHEPNYHDDGLPKDQYIRYHEEKAKGGIALTMTAGSAVVSRDSSPVFGNLHAYRDEIVPWLKRLADACHEHGSACMIQLTHLGRRTVWNGADWLPVVSPSNAREPAHRAFPKIIEDWDMERIINDYADAAERVKEAGLDGFELECYGHLLDSFWSPAINNRTDEHGGSLDNRLRFTFQVLEAIRKRVGPDYIVGLRLVADEDMEKGISRDEGVEICKRMIASGHVDFLNIIRGHIEHDGPLSRVIPVTGMASAPHLDFAGQVRAETKFPVFHAARINDVATARHAVAEGKLDMVGMTRAHIADPHIGKKVAEAARMKCAPALAPPTASTASMKAAAQPASTMQPRAAKPPCRTTSPPLTARSKHVVIVGAGPAGLKLPAYRPSAVTRSPCWKPRRKPVVKSASHPRSSAAPS